MSYRSPSVGEVSFGWSGPLLVNGSEVPLRDFPRYESPWVQAEFDPSVIAVHGAAHRLTLDWRTGERTMGS